MMDLTETKSAHYALSKNGNGKALWTQTEVAEYFRVVPGTIKNWRDRGLLPFIQPPGSTRVLIPEQAVKDFVEKYITIKKGGDKTSNLDKVKRKKPDVSPTTGKKWRI
jgi:excisionase family DNA binding protein